jgi:SAM-dependent methyltransferase
MGFFGIAPGMRVLEVCCGPGTLAPYLAEALSPGHVTGVDLDPSFVIRARANAPTNVNYVVGDAHKLPFPDGAFDAALSYTGVGVLEHPERAVAEMIRVCRPRGAVSVAESVTGPSGIRFAGVDTLAGEIWPGASRYTTLRTRLNAPAPPALGNRRWPAAAMLGLLAEAGLTDLRLNAWGYVECADAAPETQQALRERELVDEIARLDAGASSDLSAAELDELRRLTRLRWGWLEAHPAYDWVAGLSLVATGLVPALPEPK